FLTYTNTVAGGFDFLSDGLTLFFSMGTTASTSATIVRVQRQFDTTICDGTGAITACPCGNAGIAGRGCANSAVAAGALLNGVNAASVHADSYVLLADAMPPTTTCQE